MGIRAVPSRIVESYYNCTFIILRTHHTVFHGGFTILHFHVQCTRVSISPYPHKTCYFVLFFQIAILIGMKWYLMGCALLCPNDHWCWEYFYVLAGHLYSFLFFVFFFLEKCLFRYFGHFYMVIFYCWDAGALYIFWILTPYHIHYLLNFSPIPWVAFSLCIIVSSDAQKFQILNSPFFPFLTQDYGVKSKNPLPNLRLWIWDYNVFF